MFVWALINWVIKHSSQQVNENMDKETDYFTLEHYRYFFFFFFNALILFLYFKTKALHKERPCTVTPHCIYGKKRKLTEVHFSFEICIKATANIENCLARKRIVKFS